MKNKKIYFTVLGILVLCSVVLIAVPVVRNTVSEKSEKGGDTISYICKQSQSKPTSVFIMMDKNNVVGGYYAVVGKSGVKDLSLYLYNAQGTQIAYTETTDSAEQKEVFLKTYREFNITYKAKKEIICQK